MEGRKSPARVSTTSCLQPSVGPALEECLGILEQENRNRRRVGGRLVPTTFPETISKLQKMQLVGCMGSDAILVVFMRQGPENSRIPILTTFKLSKILRLFTFDYIFPPKTSVIDSCTLISHHFCH